MWTGTWTPSSLVHFYNRAGAKVRPDMWQHDLKGRTEISGYSLFDDYRSEIGYTSIMTPGSPAGFGLFHERHCSLPWAELLAPAIAQAEVDVTATGVMEGLKNCDVLINTCSWETVAEVCKNVAVVADDQRLKVRLEDFADAIGLRIGIMPRPFSDDESRLLADPARGATINLVRTLSSLICQEIGKQKGFALRAMGHEVVHSPHSFEPIMSRAHVISTLGGKMRGGADPRGGAGVGYAW